MKLSVEKKIVGSFVTALLLLSVIGVASYRSLTRLTEDAAWVRHTQEVLTHLTALLSAITDVETGQRGFAITGEEKFLEPYHSGVAASDVEFRKVRALTADNPGQQRKLDALAPVLASRLESARAGVELRRRQDFEAARLVMSRGEGKQIHDRIRASVAEMEQVENGLLKDRAVRMLAATRWTETVILAGSGLGFLCVGLALVFSLRDIAGRRRAEAAVQSLNEQLAFRALALNAANEQLKEVDRLKSEFLAAMSHELRTPLNSIIGFTGILKQGLPGPVNPEQAKQLGMVQGSARHLLGLINDLLDLSRIESGRMGVAHERFRLEEVIAEVEQTLAPLVAQRQLRLLSTVAAPLPELEGDRQKCFQVLLNLVNNAVKFTEHGEVRLDARAEDGRLIVAVSDTGIGIKPEHMALLFEAFRQVEGSARRVCEGTGLGLHLSRKLLTLLGGSIRAESEFGRGSRFTFTVPVNMPSAPMP